MCTPDDRSEFDDPEPEDASDDGLAEFWRWHDEQPRDPEYVPTRRTETIDPGPYL